MLPAYYNNGIQLHQAPGYVIVRLEMIQAAYISATGDELQSLARKFLDPNKLQIFVVADK